MNEQTRQLIQQFADQLQTTGSQAWELYVQGLQFEATLQLTLATSVLIMSSLIAYGVYRASKEQIGETVDKGGLTGKETFTHGNAVEEGIVTFIALCIIGFIVSAMIEPMLIKYMMPEYAALEQVVQAVGR